MILTRENHTDLDKMLKFCENRGLKMHAQPAMFKQRSVYGRYFDDSMQKLVLSDEQITEVHKRMTEWKHAGHQLIFSASAYRKAADWEDYSKATIQGNEWSHCMAGKYYIHIEPNGDVHPCGLNESKFSPKNILESGLSEAIIHSRKHRCTDCWMVYMNERKRVFGLRPEALLEIIKRG